jgi:VanZ family protein
MTEDLQQYQPQRPEPAKRKMVKTIIFAVLLVASFVGLYFTLGMANSQAKTVLLIVLSMNAIAAMVNLFRTFRPHKP